MTTPAIVVIGCSAGGLHALGVVLGGLPADFEVPVVVVQHRAADSHDLAALLQDTTKLVVEEAEDKVILQDGHAYLAPADYHLLVATGELALSTDAPVRFSRPSIDVLFESAADSYGGAVIAVVLTGANQDGCRGCESIAGKGGRIIAQDPATAESPTMPAAIVRSIKGAMVRKLEDIPAALIELVMHRPASTGTRS